VKGSRASRSRCHAALLGFPTVPIKNWKPAYLVIAFAWAAHALSWFLPAVHDLDDLYRGWNAFLVALSPILPHSPPNQDVYTGPWYPPVLSVASAATTFVFVVGSPLAVWRGSRSVQRACAWLAITAFILNSHWYVLERDWHLREDLSVGYFLWWLSFALLAIGLFWLSRHSTVNHRHETQTEAQEPK
jgi:hypothetical protein